MIRWSGISKAGSSDSPPTDTMPRAPPMRDEDYIVGLCDDILGLRAARHHRFPFLRGDPGKHGRTATLPVDAWYDDLRLVIEFHEIQHLKDVPFFNRRMTLSGPRREQRRMYDQRRRDELPRNDILLIVFVYSEFPCSHRG